MYEVMSKKLLVINILDILNKYSDAEHRLKQKDFIDIPRKEYGMEVDRKAVRRNLSYLLECGYDKDEESSRKKKIFQRIIAIQNIIKARLDGNIKNEYTYSDFNEIKKQIAFMNINKRGGSSSTDFKELNKYAEKYKELILIILYVAAHIGKLLIMYMIILKARKNGEIGKNRSQI